MTSTAILEANKRLVRRFHEEAESRGLLDVIDEMYAADFVDGGHPERGSGPDSVKAHVIEMRTRFPDLAVTVEHLVAEGEWVAARLRSSGTHGGAFAGITPTGRVVSWDGQVMRRIVDGRVVEQWTRYDMVGLLRQLGALRMRSGEAAGG